MKVFKPSSASLMTILCLTNLLFPSNGLPTVTAGTIQSDLPNYLWTEIVKWKYVLITFYIN